MAIATGLALGLGSAVLGAGSSILGASKNSKAIKQSTAAETAANNASLGLQRDIYGQNKQALSPYMERGNAAGGQINSLLGLGGQTDYAQYVQSNPDLQAEYQQESGNFGSMAEYGKFHYDKYGQSEGRQLPGSDAGAAQTAGFDNFRNSTGYQFRLGEGQNALNSGYAGAGVLQSGAAMREATEYGQNFASNEFGNYMGLLSNQQGVGLSGASALAGVGQNYANNVSNLNTQNANALSNAAVARANNSNGLISGLAGSVGSIAGLFGGKIA